jgi:DNA-directed RNA polymerase subunit H
MHILQPKHSILKKEETEKVLTKFNISISQLPKIKITDPAIPQNSQIGDIIKIERKEENDTFVYYRVVSI